jgi:flagellar export protein FliJ
MKKFRFSLHSVQTLRSIREMRAREVFAEALNLQVEAGSRLEAVRSWIRMLEAELVAERGALLRPADQASHLKDYETGLRLERDRMKDLDQARTRTEQAREAWVGSRRDVQVIEKLETKARHEHRLAFDREEQSLLDDRVNATSQRVPLIAS